VPQPKELIDVSVTPSAGREGSIGTSASIGRMEAMLAHPLLAVAAVARGRLRDTNDAWKKLFALPADVSIESHAAALFASAQVADRFERTLKGMLSTRHETGCGHATVEHQLVRRDGSTFLAEILVWPLDDSDHDRPLSADAIWQVRDVTAERALHAELRDLEAYHHELAKHQWDLTFVIDRKGRVSYASPSVEAVLGYRMATLLGENFASLLERGHRSAAEQWLRSSSRESHVHTRDARDGYRLHIVDHDQQKRLFACRTHNCFGVPRIAGMVIHAREVAWEPDEAERPDTEPAVPTTCDALTGLPDRKAASLLLARRIEAAADGDGLLAILVNLDRFRRVNERYGLARGDEVIVAAAARLRAAFDADALVARVGADEFLIVVQEPDAAKTDALLQSILETIAAVPTDPDVPRVEASVGLARLSAESADAEALWAKAEIAMREAKSRGRGQAVLFQSRLAAAVAARAALGSEIEDAIARREFALFYQPQIALSSGKLVGLEALLRWQHPTRGLLLPDVFIDAAIDRGLIDGITKTAFGQVCEQIVHWQRTHEIPEVPVSVNVSAQQFHDRRLPALVASALLRSGLPSRLLILELTEEHLVVDSVATERVVKELARLGVRIAIGSFGLSHPSLRALRQLRVSQIKLDRGFVDGLPDDAESAIAVKAAIEIGKRLKCQVLAEGVETRAQFECLRDLHCEAGQGFHFAAPLSSEELRNFVAANGAPTSQ